MDPLTRRRAVKSLAVAAGGAALALRGGRAPGAHAEQRAQASSPALRRSDVVFMYEADRRTYREYAATVLAWGGTPTRESLAEAEGMTVYGSVGMVTEFPGYVTRFPETWLEGVCLDVDGRRFKVPWLVDLTHRGEPYWWCCTRQPVFQAYLEERVEQTLRRGAHGLHVDDHLGSAATLYLSGCFCARCVSGFGSYLRDLDVLTRERLGVIDDPASFDYGAELRAWRARAPAGAARQPADHPLWPVWRAYQLRGAAAFMEHLRGVAERAARRPVMVSANAGLLWPNHLADYQAVDFFSAEIDHQADARIVSDRPLFAYRMADAVQRPLASTARGEDWAFVAATGCHGLVTSWAALGYAAGHMLMAPHRQWCHTEEKGTHWYDGPGAVFAPVYRFVRDRAELLDGLAPWADVALVMPHRAFARTPARWIAMGEALAAANVSYRVVIGGDEVVAKRITGTELESVPLVVNPAPEDLDPADRGEIGRAVSRARAVTSVDEAVRLAAPAVRASSDRLRVLPRVAPGRAVIHLVNRDYDAARDAVRPQSGVVLRCDLRALGVPGARRARLISYGRAPREVAIDDGRIDADVETIWTMVDLRG